MVVCEVGPPRLHACLEAVAFLSEIISRVIIIGRYLGHSSNQTVSGEKRYPDIHDTLTVFAENGQADK